MTLDRLVDRILPRTAKLADRIHAHPELALEEHRASAAIATFLAHEGFEVTRGTAGFPTAFVARLAGGRPGPTIALVAEYDAVPEVGHGCGHNLMGTSSAAAASVAVSLLGDEFPGEIRVIGTPAEEMRHVKVEMIAAGSFAGVDAALQIHPYDRSSAEIGLLAIADRIVQFHGRAAHPLGAPWVGRNALDAMIAFFVAISQSRLHARPGDSIHGYITNGGSSPNTIPAETAARFYIRSARDQDLDQLIERFGQMADGAALATGCTVSVLQGSANRCSTMWNNQPMADRWRRHLAEGGGVDGPQPTSLGSSDMGNVSQIVPTIHPYLAVATRGTALHTVDFHNQCAGPAAQKALRLAIRTLAATVVDLIEEPELLASAQESFRRQAAEAGAG